MSRPPKRAWSNAYLGQDHRTGWQPTPDHYPAGNVSPTGEVQPVSIKEENRRRLRAAWKKQTRPQAKARKAKKARSVKVEPVEANLGQFVLATNKTVEEIRQDDLTHAAEFAAEEE